MLSSHNISKYFSLNFFISSKLSAESCLQFYGESGIWNAERWFASRKCVRLIEQSTAITSPRLIMIGLGLING